MTIPTRERFVHEPVAERQRCRCAYHIANNKRLRDRLRHDNSGIPWLLAQIYREQVILRNRRAPTPRTDEPSGSAGAALFQQIASTGLFGYKLDYKRLSAAPLRARHTQVPEKTSLFHCSSPLRPTNSACQTSSTRPPSDLYSPMRTDYKPLPPMGHAIPAFDSAVRVARTDKRERQFK